MTADTPKVHAYEASKRLASRHPVLRQAFFEYEELFEDDASQMPVTAFGELGRAIARNWDCFSDQDRTNIFDHIEWLMKLGEGIVRDCVATGLIEALSAECDERRLHAKAVAPFLGRESRAYWLAWGKFNGISTPGL